MLKFLLFLVISINIFSYTSVSPLYFDEKIDGEGGYKEYTLSNSTRKVVSYKIYFEKKNKENDMSDWVEYYPKKIILNPGETKKIKVLITSPLNTRKGEYITNFCIKEVEILGKKNNNVSFLTNLKIELAGYVGDLATKLEVKNLKLLSNKLVLDVENIGEKREWLELYLVQENKKYYIDSLRLFKGDKKHIEKKLDIPLKKDLKLLIINRKNQKVFEDILPII